jgi:hypothetical protein
MQTICDRQFLEEELSKLSPNRYNCYQWWRRYESRNNLSKKAPLYDKIKNGDYDPSKYLYQAEMELYLLRDKTSKLKNVDDIHDITSLCMERHRRLVLDYEKEEFKILSELKSDFVRTFKLEKSDLEQTMECFDGTILELYNFYKNRKLEK